MAAGFFWILLKNEKRKWCSMQHCGSSGKALEYYYRKKKEKDRSVF
ncbi:CGNR zinc finger domain-containing protein [Chryseolinea lacunae]|uniref:CGNR zinc finger domain-containing protein n=1 Tax=Chryseolinea lacunae TaxID=2801331 RepID=A0ABS1KL97_9BACT|nr:CGNR zinc finger domain-containing protein [Chryseolinea lacunae]